MNDKQLEVAEKILVNSANVILATLILGNALSPKGFNLILFFLGSILFVAIVIFAFSLRKKGGP